MQGLVKVWVLAIIGLTWSCCIQAAYVSENRNVVSSGIPRSYVLARPASIPPGTALPLVFSLHGDGGNGSVQDSLPLFTV